MKRRLRLAVICDAVEEGWPSMDYVAEMLVKHLQDEHGETFETVAISPRFFRGFERLRPGNRSFNADRATTRFLTYPMALLGRRADFDHFHIADHTYAQLAHVLPRQRTGIFCHDLDAFEPVLGAGPRATAGWRRAMATVQLRGLQRASVVFFSTEGIRERILSERLLPEAKLVHAPYGIAAEYSRAQRLPLPTGVRIPYLLHVGGNFPRKRIDVLLRIVAEVRQRLPEVLLVQVGAKLADSDRALLRSLRLETAIVQPPPMPRAELASLYAQAELLLVTSEREGFGLPLLEGLAAGVCVVASDIAPLREIGGRSVAFCPVADVAQWSATVLGLLRSAETRPSLTARREQAARFSWKRHAEAVAAGYGAFTERG